MQLSSVCWFCVLFLFIFGCVGSYVAACGLSSLIFVVRASHCSGFSLLWSVGSRRVGFSSRGTQAQQWHRGLVAPWHVGSPWTRAQTRVPCIGRQILNHCATREVPILAFIIAFFFTFLRSLFLHSASNYCLVSFHFTLQDSHAYFLQSTSSAHKLPQLLFIWECPNFSLTFEGQFCLISDFLINLFIYLFIIYFWLCWVFVSVWGLSPVVASGGHSSSRCVGLSLLRPLPLRSTGSRHAGSVIVAHGLSCSAACGIFPDQGSNPCPPHWQADS